MPQHHQPRQPGCTDAGRRQARAEYGQGAALMQSVIGMHNSSDSFAPNGSVQVPGPQTCGNGLARKTAAPVTCNASFGDLARGRLSLNAAFTTNAHLQPCSR